MVSLASSLLDSQGYTHRDTKIFLLAIARF